MQSKDDHRCNSGNVEYSRKRSLGRTKLEENESRYRSSHNERSSCPNPALRRNKRGCKRPPVHPLVLKGNRAAQDVCQENQHATHAQCEDTVYVSGVSAETAAGPRAIERKRSEVLRGKMIRHKGV